MNLRTFLAAFSALALTSAAAAAQSANDLNEGSRLTLDPATGAYTFSWWGKTERAYLLQQSEDLVTWIYLPIIEPGSNQVVSWSFTASASRLFVRLKASSLLANEDPFARDSDGDGISDYEELLGGADPLTNVDANGNGLPDDWEAAHPGHANPAADPEFDGLTNAQEFTRRTNPARKDNPAVKLSADAISQ